MPSIISAGTTSGTSLNLSGDTSGVLQLQTNGVTPALTIDTSQNVGIGTASPGYRLHIAGGHQFLQSGYNQYYGSTSNFIGGDSGLGAVFFGAGGGSQNYMSFATASTERMRITSTGQVGIGTTTPGTTLNVFTGSTLQGLRIQRFAGAYYSELRQTDGPESLAFLVGDGATVAERMRISGTGAVVLQGGTTTANGVGITFPATQSASSDANTLDDYEEGSTTIFFADAPSGGNAYAVTDCSYTKIGRVVTVRFSTFFLSSPTWTSGNQIVIRGLPFVNVGEISMASIMINTTLGDTYPVYVWGVNGTTRAILKRMFFFNDIVGGNMQSTITSYGMLVYNTNT